MRGNQFYNRSFLNEYFYILDVYPVNYVSFNRAPHIILINIYRKILSCLPTTIYSGRLMWTLELINSELNYRFPQLMEIGCDPVTLIQQWVSPGNLKNSKINHAYIPPC